MRKYILESVGGSAVRVRRILGEAALLAAMVVTASWVLLANNEADFGPEVAAKSTPLAPQGREWLWTDGYSNLFRILR